ncbi:hypothetical protein ABL78_2352 [Leptomonas seymouri]|uniref:Uncharacterized protein n=1 Tax=Leptomonas seymouri TaxID=5684 RepID=A0A0N1ILM8_LEPSE|nr:hypothetical protein ABL78_2352 [Leptomonas seymouri]|eukprot:KPI88540.1 hypothetical protein ABL78_2352 [Leptomonas seymouri]
METTSVVHSVAVNTDSGPIEDQDLTMASRESAQHAANIQNEAYRQALSELAGELYIEAYKDSLQQAMERQRRSWNTIGA